VLAATVPSLGWDQVLLRLAVAALLGAAIGLEREMREREAGLRTHLLVSLGSALFTIISAYGFHGFLTSGGALVRSVRGLTTAATLWVAAGIGMATGAGFYSGALIGTVVTIVALGPLRILAFPVLERMRVEERSLVIVLRQGTRAGQLLEALEHEQARVEHFHLEDERDRRIVTLRLDTPSAKLYARVADLDFVQGVEWGR